MELIQNQKENTFVASEHIENAKKTLVLRGHLWKTHGKHTCCVNTYGKRNENTGVALEFIENAKKTRALRVNPWKTQGKHMGCVGTL